MAAFKYPLVVEFRETLPMTAIGKVLKRELRAPYRPDASSIAAANTSTVAQSPS